MLAGLFAAFGVKSDDAVEYANRIVGWRSPAPKDQGTSDEDGLYRSAGLNYSPRGGPFAHVDELWLVYELPPALVERIMPFVTVYSGLPKVNVRDAAPEVIAALPGMTPALLNSFLDKRESGPIDEQSLQGLLGPDQAAAATTEFERHLSGAGPDRIRQWPAGRVGSGHSDRHRRRPLSCLVLARRRR